MTLLAALYWLACFGVALVYAARRLRQAVGDRDGLVAEKKNGVALIEALAAVRRAGFRLVTALVMFASGLVGLRVPDVDAPWTAARVIFTVAFLVFATAYALDAHLDERARARSLKLLDALL